jgi:hypothetical protein
VLVAVHEPLQSVCTAPASSGVHVSGVLHWLVVVLQMSGAGQVPSAAQGKGARLLRPE